MRAASLGKVLPGRVELGIDRRRKREAARHCLIVQLAGQWNGSIHVEDNFGSWVDPLNLSNELERLSNVGFRLRRVPQDERELRDNAVGQGLSRDLERLLGRCRSALIHSAKRLIRTGFVAKEDHSKPAIAHG